MIKFSYFYNSPQLVPILNQRAIAIHTMALNNKRTNKLTRYT